MKEIVLRACEAGILTVIDGAHVAGQIPLYLDSLGADFYGCNLHISPLWVQDVFRWACNELPPSVSVILVNSHDFGKLPAVVIDRANMYQA